MKHANKKSKRPRRPRGDSDYGLVKRVAEKLKVSPTWVSNVKNGIGTSEPITKAIAAERALMRREQRELAHA